jgi:excinuclease UvrABC nuclease subunit
MIAAVLLLAAAAAVYVATHPNLLYPTRVYFLCSHSGRLLYVGKTNNLDARLQQHASDRRKRAWWHEVDLQRTRSVRFPNRPLASVAEVVGIVVLQPRHNIAWRGRRRL